MWEILGYSIAGLLGLLLILLLIPVSVGLTYGDELRVCVRVLGIPIFRFPTAPKPAKPSTASHEVSAFSERLKRDSVGETVRVFEQLAALAAGTVRRVLSAVTVDKLQLQLYITGSDAAQTAENTGKICAVLYPAVAAVQQTVLRIKHREITVTPDFLADTGRVLADVTAHVIPLRAAGIVLWTCLRYGAITKQQKEVLRHGKQGTKSDGSVDR